MAPKFKVRAGFACRIVNLDRVKFNDAVASGTYPCAPSTRSGAARIFEEEELLPLFFFARLTEFGLPAGRAGYLACQMGETARSDDAEPAERIIYVHGQTGSGFFIPNKSKRPKDGEIVVNYVPEHETPTEEHPTGGHYPGTGRVLFTIDFYIKHVREIIKMHLDYEASILEKAAKPATSIARTADEQAHERGFYRGESSAATHIARAFSALDAMDDDNLRTALAKSLGDADAG